ncbi:CLUMA_CG005603, isoform A [Clunio marinus]|uniref:CLUMA_CG005603, isoform A n=1 Tax=Clunio marinus TaxID=568069 RepID=A0A1J1HVB6_9DIPT|nr:CLUMA_CG005603, isoform A [Clunio marinus]
MSLSSICDFIWLLSNSSSTVSLIPDYEEKNANATTARLNFPEFHDNFNFTKDWPHNNATEKEPTEINEICWSLNLPSSVEITLMS